MKHDVELRMTHDAMARFLLQMLKYSDKEWRSKRTRIVEKHYQEALRLVRRAGLKYEPPKAK
jgi:hypothetical protein